MASEVFPSPRIFLELYKLVRQEFRYKQPDYSQSPQATGTGLEKEVVKLLERYSIREDFHVHLTDRDPAPGFSGLLHKFDAGIKNKSTWNQCLFEVKYRGDEGNLAYEDIMKFHHATFEYFLKLLTEHHWDEANIFRSFVTTKRVSNAYRQFFYTWGIVLIDPELLPIPGLVRISEDFQKEIGPTDQILSLIEQANELIEQAYFSLAQLVPEGQRYGNVLSLDKLNPATESEKILDQHQFLYSEAKALKKYVRGN